MRGRAFIQIGAKLVSPLLFLIVQSTTSSCLAAIQTIDDAVGQLAPIFENAIPGPEPTIPQDFEKANYRPAALRWLRGRGEFVLRRPHSGFGFETLAPQDGASGAGDIEASFIADAIRNSPASAAEYVPVPESATWIGIFFTVVAAAAAIRQQTRLSGRN
jgi:hypothetical protein